MSAWEIYDRLIDAVSDDDTVCSVTCGNSWTRVVTRGGKIGIAAAQEGDRKKTQALVGLSLRDAARQIKSWDFALASAAQAAINAQLNQADRFQECGEPDAFLRYRDMCRGKKVCVVGHFAYLENRLKEICDLYVLERKPSGIDYPDPACEYLLPEADVCFITASALTNKTMPRLLALSGNAFTVISGPSTPMDEILFSFGADALCGFCVTDPRKCDDALLDCGKLFDSGKMVCAERRTK